MSYLLVFTTVPTRRQGQNLAHLLIDQRLAACCNLIPALESFYRWKGKKECSKELLLIIKSNRKLYPKLEKAIQKHHSYDVPEIIALPIGRGSKAYLSWLNQQLGV